MTTHPNMQFRAHSEPTESDDYLAEVVELPLESTSFYQRNSGSLPKSNKNRTDYANLRAALPSAENETDSVFTRLRQVLGL